MLLLCLCSEDDRVFISMFALRFLYIIMTMSTMTVCTFMSLYIISSHFNDCFAWYIAVLLGTLLYCLYSSCPFQRISFSPWSSGSKISMVRWSAPASHAPGCVALSILGTPCILCIFYVYTCSVPVYIYTCSVIIYFCIYAFAYLAHNIFQETVRGSEISCVVVTV